MVDVIRKFFTEIINQFSITPKIFCTDNTLNFVQQDVQNYCASLDVLHQTSCPRTSQQNNVVKQKHRHLLDVTRTIMLQMKVPKYLWSDAMLIASYLINRMPSTPPGGEVPFRRLYPDM